MYDNSLSDYLLVFCGNKFGCVGRVYLERV